MKEILEEIMKVWESESCRMCHSIGGNSTTGYLYFGIENVGFILGSFVGCSWNCQLVVMC